MPGPTPPGMPGMDQMMQMMSQGMDPSKMDMNQGDDFTEDEQDETSRRATKAKGDKPEEAEPAR